MLPQKHCSTTERCDLYRHRRIAAKFGQTGALQAQNQCHHAVPRQQRPECRLAGVLHKTSGVFSGADIILNSKGNSMKHKMKSTTRLAAALACTLAGATFATTATAAPLPGLPDLNPGTTLVAPVTDLLGGLTSGLGNLGSLPTDGLLAPVTGLLGSLGGSPGDGLLAPVTGLLGNVSQVAVAYNVNGTGNSFTLNPVADLLGGNLTNLPLTGVLSSLPDALGGLTDLGGTNGLPVVGALGNLGNLGNLGGLGGGLGSVTGVVTSLVGGLTGAI